MQSPHAEVYQWLGLTPPWETNKGWQCAESGQVFFDKSDPLRTTSSSPFSTSPCRVAICRLA